MEKKNPYMIRLSNGIEVKLLPIGMSFDFEINGKILSRFSREPILRENAKEIVEKFSKIWKKKLKFYNEILQPMDKVVLKASKSKLSKKSYPKIMSCMETLKEERNKVKYIYEDIKGFYWSVFGEQLKD